MSSGIDFGVHCEVCYGVDVTSDDLWVDRDGQRWATCRSCYQNEHDEGLKRLREAEAKLAAIRAQAEMPRLSDQNTTDVLGIARTVGWDQMRAAVLRILDGRGEST